MSTGALIEDYIKPHLGQKGINRLTTGDVRAFLLTLQRMRSKSGRGLFARTFLTVADEHWFAALWRILINDPADRRSVPLWRAREPPIQAGDPASRRLRRRPPQAQADQYRESYLSRWSPLVDRPADLVFVTSTGRPIDPRSLNRAFDRLLSNAGVTHACLYDLRYTLASLLLHEGASDREVMELLDHSSINITMNTYAHVLDEAKRRSADQMDGLLGAD